MVAMQEPQLAPSIERKMAENGIQPPSSDDVVEELDDVDLEMYE